jgi:hypothetical protein
VGAVGAHFGLAVIGIGRGTVVKRHDDIGANVHLGDGGRLGRQKLTGAVDVGFELGARFGNFGFEALDLEAAGIGQYRPIPAHKPMDTAQRPDILGSGAQEKMIVIGQDDLGPDAFEVVRGEGFDRSRGTHGHEYRQSDAAMRSGQGFCFPVKFKHLQKRLYMTNWLCEGRKERDFVTKARTKDQFLYILLAVVFAAGAVIVLRDYSIRAKTAETGQSVLGTAVAPVKAAQQIPSIKPVRK